jgi:hypothetical protein
LIAETSRLVQEGLSRISPSTKALAVLAAASQLAKAAAIGTSPSVIQDFAVDGVEFRSCGGDESLF